MSEWRRVRLDECCTIVGGATPSTLVPAYWDGDIRWATPKDLSDLEGALIAETPRKLTKEGLASCAADVLPVGSVLFSSRAPIGHVALNTVPMATNQGFKSFIPEPELLDAKFLYHWLRRNRAYLESLGNGATFKEVSKAVVSRIKILLPPLPEQRRIAEVLDRAEALRAKRRAALAQLDTLTQSIFLDIFGDPATNRKGWPMVTIADICEVKGGKRLPKGEEYSATPTPFRYIRVTNLQSGAVDESALVYLKPDIQAEISRYIVNTGDVIISIAGSIGLIAPVPASLDGANLTENAAKLVPRVKGRYDEVFLAAFLQTSFGRGQILSHVGQVTIGKLALFRIEKIRVPLPPVEAQRRFARCISAIAHSREVHRASLTELDALFAAIQHRAFRGEL